MYLRTPGVRVPQVEYHWYKTSVIFVRFYPKSESPNKFAGYHTHEILRQNPQLNHSCEVRTEGQTDISDEIGICFLKLFCEDVKLTKIF